MPRHRNSSAAASFLTLATALAVAPLFAFQEPEPAVVDRLLFRDPELYISEQSLPASRLAGTSVPSRLAQLAIPMAQAHVDLRTGRFATLYPTAPLLPGTGVGNRLTWAGLAQAAPQTDAELAQSAWIAFAGWLDRYASALGIDPKEVVAPGRVSVMPGDYIVIWSPRRVAGLPVQGSYLQATIKSGNLILFGTVNWGTFDDAMPFADLSVEDAKAALARHIDPFQAGADWKASELVWVPTSTADTLAAADLGRGLDHRLAWLIRTTLGEPGGRYQALVDARNGKVLAIENTVQNLATTRTVKGGVLPISNDGVNPDGVEQANWPMPYTAVTTPSGLATTDVGGNLPLCVDGNITSALTGRYVAMADACGAASLTSSSDLNFSASAGTDCTTPGPGIGGAGNTHASRSGYFEINMIKAQARGQLPSNTWLQDQLTANMNINQTCNANWNGAAVNFYRSGGGCFNTGELAGVFDHEWGHGMDNNDANPTISSPGEGIADIYASLRLNTSCMGRHFRATNCTGYGNACLSCSGVRDIDWDKHTNHTAFTIANADACANNPTGSNGPCNGSAHCEGQIYSQSVWDLWNRDLTGAPANLSLDVAREVATQLTYRGAAGVGNWYACTNGTGGCGNPAGCGCAATNGYQQFIAADDDNGSLADGTPHMQDIFDAFSRHSIACTTPTVTTAGCAGNPTELPVVTATPRDRAVALSWTASTGATGYRVYRTDGVFGCDFGKQLLATVVGTTFVDSGLQNGRTYSYQVVPMGSDDACFQVASSCTPGTPAPGVNLALDTSAASMNILTGDADAFLDNCETARITVPVSNTGTSTLTNLRVVNVTSPSHPTTTFLTSFPLTINASSASCAPENAIFDIQAADLDPGETLMLNVEVTADELLGDTRVGTASFTLLESDYQHFATKTFGFESNTEGWVTTQGTFVRDSAGGGGNATAFYMKSSANLDNQCDVVRSPLVRLSATSTMTLFNSFNIEPNSGGWWDRANVGIRPNGSNTRTLVTPSGGRTYNASGANGVCGTEGQGGWAATNTAWASSTWTNTALQSGTFAGQSVQLEVRYGTDSSVNSTGFHFDEVTVTDVDVQAPDTFSNVCVAAGLLSDGFESGNVSAWNFATP